MAGLQLERVLVHGRGIGGRAGLLHDVAEVVDGIDVIGPQLDRAAHQRYARERLPCWWRITPRKCSASG